VFDPQSVYRAANISGHQVERVVEALWFTLNRLYERLVGSTYPADEYSARDIATLHALYMERAAAK
jgi:hypothetical protein